MRIEFKLQQVMRSGCGFRTFRIPAPVHQLSSLSLLFGARSNRSFTKLFGVLSPGIFRLSLGCFFSCCRFAMAKGDYKGTVLTGASTYRAWRAMFIAECKSEKLWKYVDGSAILPGPDPRSLPSNATTSTTETSNASLTGDISAVETWLDKKETYEVGFEQAKEKCFMSG